PPCAVQTHQGRIVGRRRNDDRARKSLFAEDALHELLDLATALADQPDDDHFRAGIARHHAEQHALADAAAREEPDALAAPDSEKRIDRANADVERLLDRLSRERVDCGSGQPNAIFAMKRASTVERHTRAVDDAPEQALADDRHLGTDTRYDSRIRLEPMNVAGRHEKESVARESHDLRLDGSAIACEHVAAIADGGLTSGGFERESDHSRQHAFHRRQLNQLGTLRIAL